MTRLESFIRHSPWAQGLGADDLAAVLRDAHERRVPAGGHAMRAGEDAAHWVGVIEGLVKMSVSQPDGRHTSFTGVGPGGWAGEGSLLRGGPWRYDGIAVRPTVLACLPRRRFEQLVATSLPFNHHLLAQLNARLGLFIGLVEHHRLLDPDARVARCLASLFDPALCPQAGPFVALSQEEIGLLAAVSRQRAHQALHRLQAAGLLRLEFGGVSVIDLAGLRGHGRPADAPDAAGTPGRLRAQAATPLARNRPTAARCAP